MSAAQALELESTATSTAPLAGASATASRAKRGWSLYLKRFAEIAGS